MANLRPVRTWQTFSQRLVKQEDAMDGNEEKGTDSLDHMDPEFTLRTLDHTTSVLDSNQPNAVSVEMYQRYRFHTRVQQKKENVSDYMKALQQISMACNFDEDTASVNKLIVDQFVHGLRDRTMKRVLLQQKQLSMDNVVQLAQMLESLEHNENQVFSVFLPAKKTPRTIPTWRTKLAHVLSVKNDYIRLALAEFLGTFVFVILGLASIAQTVFSKGSDGSIVTIILGWSLGITMGIYTCGGVSGGHINPAFTTAMVIMGRLPIKKMPFYFIGQYLGSLFASLCIYLVYFEALQHYDGGVRQNPTDMANHLNNETATVWASYPKPHISAGQSLFDQIVATGVLILVVMAIIDERNMAVPKGLVPLAVGLAVTAVLTGFVYNCGCPLNPARDLSPRIFITIAGWGPAPFQFRGGNWFWVPVLGPHIGAIAGALLYNVCIGLHWPKT